MVKRGEKKITTWKFKIDDVPVEVPVFVVEADSERYGTLKGKMHFTVRFEIGEAVIEKSDTDVERLHTAVEAELKERIQMNGEIYILVEVRGNVPWKKDDEKYMSDECSSSIDFQYDFYVIGKKPNGTEFHIEVPIPESVSHTEGTWDGKWDKLRRKGSAVDGLPTTGFDTYGYHGMKRMKTLLPATVENVESVLRFDNVLRSLSKEMMERFSEKKILKTLSLFGNGQTLALPQSTSDDKELLKE
jgi:hypothetical protein